MDQESKWYSMFKWLNQKFMKIRITLLVRVAIIMAFYEKALKGIMVNDVPREVLRSKSLGPAAPRVLALGPP